MTEEICPICDNQLSSGCQPWHLHCKRCRYEKANLQPAINLHSNHQLIDEDDREAGLRDLRKKNFAELLDQIKSLRGSGGRLLEVGSAHGWFLEAARDDFEILGIEPDEYICESTLRRGLPVRRGYFPDVLEANETFDVIVFNDVLEHIPDAAIIISCCHECLRDNGLLVLNLPCSNGIFYKVSKLFCKLGLTSFFERLWQKDLPSPHLHYFNSANLIRFLKGNGFDVRVNGRLPALRLAGLYSRIAYAGGFGIIARFIIYIGVALSLPVLKIFPSDIIYVVSEKNTECSLP